MLLHVLLTLGASSAVIASPVIIARQATDSPTATPSPAQTSLTSSTSVTGSGSDAVTSLTSAISSAAANTTAAPAPTGTPDTSNTTQYPYSCPAGYALSYVLGRSDYPNVPIQQAYNALLNWTQALPPPITLVSQNGSGANQAQRSWTIPGQNFTVSELLTNQTVNASTGYLDQIWVSTNAINVSSSLIIANATSDLTLFVNSTNSNVTEVQFYVNFCASSQPSGLDVYSQLVSTYLQGLNALFTASAGNATTTANPTGVTGSVPTSSISSTVSGVSSSVSGAADTAASAISGAASTAISGAGGAATTAVSAVTGAGDTAISAVTGAASTAVSGASSVLGQVTSLF